MGDEEPGEWADPTDEPPNPEPGTSEPSDDDEDE